MTPVSRGHGVAVRNCLAPSLYIRKMHTQFTPVRGAVHRIDPDDDVAVAIRQLEAGETVALSDSDNASVHVRELIPRGHKLALRNISAGNPVRKYGWPIGQAKSAIAAGSLVHTDNLT